MIYRYQPSRIRTFKAHDVTRAYRTYGRLRPVKRGWSTV